ncbi:MAG: dihydroorotate dehydrogenase-like protein [Spirochaetales bacterium]|nr:dihydroorotate dehydrogenase-like protein [Spirochaetales bacterium]
MASLNTKYLGLDLQSPLIVSSSTLTGKVEAIKKLADYGAGAVVLKSLFEEDIRGTGDIAVTEEIQPGTDLWMQNVGMEKKPASYLAFIGEVKKQVNIPIIASINCHSLEDWGDYVRHMKEAGASAVEINLAPMADHVDLRSQDLEKQAVKLISKLNKELDLPLAVKIGSNYSSLPHFTAELGKAGADGLVLFNRFWQPDIDINKMTFSTGIPFSTESELAETLRWTGLLSSMIKTDISASRGVHGPEDVIKLLLAGATTVQVCSVLYKNGIDYFKELVDGLDSWMDKKGFASIDDFKGKVKTSVQQRRSFYEQLQYTNPKGN